MGFKYYYLFQQMISPDIDGLDDAPGKHSNKSIIIGGQAAYVQYPHMSFLPYFGPKQYLLAIDCRAERKVEQICSKESYNKIFDRVRKLPDGVEHLVILLGVPLACAYIISAWHSKLVTYALTSMPLPCFMQTHAWCSLSVRSPPNSTH